MVAEFNPHAINPHAAAAPDVSALIGARLAPGGSPVNQPRSHGSRLTASARGRARLHTGGAAAAVGGRCGRDGRGKARVAQPELLCQGPVRDSPRPEAPLCADSDGH